MEGRQWKVPLSRMNRGIVVASTTTSWDGSRSYCVHVPMYRMSFGHSSSVICFSSPTVDFCFEGWMEREMASTYHPALSANAFLYFHCSTVKGASGSLMLFHDPQVCSCHITMLRLAR